MTETLQPVDLLAIALALAALIGCINYLWVKLPPAIGMLLGSLVLSLIIVSSDRLFHLHVMTWLRGTLDSAHFPRVFLNAVLALLLFAGSLHVDIAELNRRRGMILLLATASVLIATTIFGAGMWLAFSVIGMAVPLIWCVLLGAILAPTDAVVVATLLRQVGLPPSLRAAIVGESLFNDGAGVVLFLLALGVTQGETFHLGHGQVPDRDAARDRRRRRSWLRRRLAGGVADAADRRRRAVASDLAGAGVRQLSHRQPARTVRPDRRGLRRALPGVAVAALRHDREDARRCWSASGGCSISS